jgi:UDP-N-acetylglucosamine 2-epimerase (non-hydrolysing)
VRNKIKSAGISLDSVVSRCGIPASFARDYLQTGERPRRWVLITGHRRESFGEGFENICRAIAGLAERYPDLGLLYPVHLNPNVQEPVRRILGDNPRVALIPPVVYEDFIWLMDRSTFVLSDSGGVQEEAPSLGKPVLVMRDTTERPEGVEAGTCVLVGTNPAKILAESAVLLDQPDEYKRRSRLANPYGDGRASQIIRTVLEQNLAG